MTRTLISAQGVAHEISPFFVAFHIDFKEEKKK